MQKVKNVKNRKLLKDVESCYKKYKKVFEEDKKHKNLIREV